MGIPLAEVGRHGCMNVAFVLQDDKTVLRQSYCEIPFKITRVLNSRGPAAHLMLMHCTAGLFGGDELECSIRVERGARVLVTQQSATKVHPSDDRAAIQRTNVVVETGAELELYLEPVIPFADSLLRQTTQIDVEPGGRLVFWEALMAGRVGRGERWQFRELSLETHLRLNDRSVYLDRFLLPTGLEPSAQAMGKCGYLGTGLYVGERARGIVTALHEAMPEAGIDALTDEVGVARVVSATGPEFHRCREMFCRITKQFR
jgi:urease accessory protein